MRCLEIGPGKIRLDNFETFNLDESQQTDGYLADHIGDARSLPFDDGIYDIVYSSHCIEHFNWWEVGDVIKEWARILVKGGSLEVWTVNGLLIMEELINLENTGKCSREISKNWLPEKVKKDPYLWLSGKLFNYAKHGEFDHQMHRAVITPKFLLQCFYNAGLSNVRAMDISEYRTTNVHGWFNMGVCGIK